MVAPAPCLSHGHKYQHLCRQLIVVLPVYRAGCVLFMVSAYILFLNPLILSGASAGANTGMPSDSVVAATAISTGVATAFMGFVSCLLCLRAHTCYAATAHPERAVDCQPAYPPWSQPSLCCFEPHIIPWSCIVVPTMPRRRAGG